MGLGSAGADSRGVASAKGSTRVTTICTPRAMTPATGRMYTISSTVVMLRRPASMAELTRENVRNLDFGGVPTLVSMVATASGVTIPSRRNAAASATAAPTPNCTIDSMPDDTFDRKAAASDASASTSAPTTAASPTVNDLIGARPSRRFSR